MNRKLCASLIVAIGCGWGQRVFAAPPIASPLARPNPAQAVVEFVKTHGVRFDRRPNQDVRSALDALCHQRDCYASQLYWHTDLEQAKATAKVTGKPILSLRLLGNLDEELSCANSRFFRVALYANTEISRTLRDRFVLHWSSERPVPKLTLDFGDGRKLTRTLTGNSIHYVLDADGRPIEALPGLYSPQVFLTQLQQIDAAFQRYQQASNDSTQIQSGQFWRNYHHDRLIAAQTAWRQELRQAGLKIPPVLNDTPVQDPRVAARIALSKSRVELPIVVQFGAATRTQGELLQITDEAAWQKLASRVPSQLDANSLALMQSKLEPNTSPTALTTTARQFERNMALDTARNEYILHSMIHQWFMAGNDTSDWVTLNQRVYTEMFLTPKSDPWLGLNPQDAFAAIEDNGVLP
jgi:hypothetical protein